MSRRALVLSGGVGHPFDATSSMLAELLGQVDIDADVTDDIERGLAGLAANGHELLVVNALRWRMTADRYTHLRDAWAFELSARGRTAITEHVAGGRGVLAVHTAAICFDDWRGWHEVLGATWDWDRSSHPPIGEVHITVAVDRHPIVRGMDGFCIVDEVYGFLDAEPGLEPLAWASHAGQAHPLLWARELDGARVVVDLLGHDERSFAHPTHQRILKRAALWAVGDDPLTEQHDRGARR